MIALRFDRLLPAPSTILCVALCAGLCAGTASAQAPPVQARPAQAPPAPACPPALEAARRLIVVRTADMNAVAGELTTYVRRKAGGRWVKRSGPLAAVVGRTGIGWGVGFRDLQRGEEPVKAEGDKRTPAGIYPLGRTFGFAREDRVGHLRLLRNRHFCVDEPASPHYGRIVSKTTAGEGTSGEMMRAEPLYRRGIVVEYPPDAAGKGGSCIFMHVRRDDGEGTSGCVALPERAIEELQDWVSGGAAAIAVLPATAADRFAGCLPP